MDRISELNLAAVIARIEREGMVPPPELAGEALAMFHSIADGNRQKPWGAAHAAALADYCRVSVMWAAELNAITTEGTLGASGNKANARFRVVQILSSERLRLARLLGLTVGARDHFNGNNKRENVAREMGARMAESGAADGGNLLA